MPVSPRQWNTLLASFGALILAGSVASAWYFVDNLAREERKKVEIWLAAQSALMEGLSAEGEQCDLTLHTQILESNTTIPVVLTGPYGDVLGGRNFGKRDGDSAYLAAVVAELEAAGAEAIVIDEDRVYYTESKLLRRLRYFPPIQLALIASFLALGYLALSARRRAEQNRVWVGLAKETAHQLGTPISAIMAWVEYLRAERGDDAELAEVADELGQDVERLNLVAERFNKIGSAPELLPEPLGPLLTGVHAYMRRRAPRKVDFALEIAPQAAGLHVAINKNLFTWVLENLIRNALDAMDGRGRMRLSAKQDGRSVEITVADSGKGIPSGKQRKVFEPGYTTKSRGWGLGLSLAKRIVEEYHGGKIFVKESTVDRGTTFAVRLPVDA